MAELAKLALEKVAPKGPPRGDEPYGGAHNEGIRMAMEDFLKAVRENDADAMASAFEDAVLMCQDAGLPLGG